MTIETEHLTLIPSARRLMSSLRDIGYDLVAAVADLVDNSIDARADRIDITFGYAGSESWIRIADNGLGMTARELDEAMRYGSARTYRKTDLGHFGLGLKTASLSQCRRLTVAGRSTPRARIAIRRWDLDCVQATDAWSLERLVPSQCGDQLLEPLRRTGGTVVLWEQLDRVLAYERPDGAAAMTGMRRLARDVAEHLSMVFHRYLDGELRRGRSRVRITVDGQPITAWDPFARDEPATEVLPEQWLTITHAGRRHRVRIRPHILPNQIRFTSPEAHAIAAGPKRWNLQQGLYVYRHDRLVQSGGWNRLRTLDEHSKLARVALDIPPNADAAFHTSVSKMTVSIPQSIRSELAAVLSGVIAHAQEVYRQRIELVQGGSSTPRAAPKQHTTPMSGRRLADDWPLITAILERELADQPGRLRRILVALANADTTANSEDTSETVTSTM